MSDHTAEWPEWTDEIAYVPVADYCPTIEEQEEARDFFAESAVESFEEFVCGLPDNTFVEVSRAIRTLRETITRYNLEKHDWDPPLGMIDILEIF